MKKLHLFELPNELYAKLTPEFCQFLFSLAKEKAKKWSILAKILETDQSNLSKWKDNEILFPIKILRILSSFLNLEESKIEKNIIAIKFKSGFINHPKLPIKVSPSLGLILASVLGDGGVSKSGYEVHYTNKIHSQVDSFLFAIKEIFGDVRIVDDKIREDDVRTIKLSGVLGRVFVKNFNIPLGKKIYYDFNLPQVIFSDTNISKSFLRRFYDDEGTVNKSKLISLKTTIEKNSKERSDGPKRLFDLKTLFEHFHIRSSKPLKVRDRSYIHDGKLVEVEDWELNIHDRNSLQLFAKNIGFEIDYKMQNLEKTIKSYKLWETPKNESLNFFLDNAKQLTLKNGMFNSKQLSEKTERSIRRTNKIINKLHEKKLIQQIDNGIRNRNFKVINRR